MTATQKLEKIENLQKVVEFLGKWQERSKKRPLVNSFLHLLVQGKKNAAKTILTTIKISEFSPWHIGYVNALEGMISASEAKKDRNVFINQIKAENGDKLRKIFLMQSKFHLHDEFDKGYLAAWADYMQALKMATKSM